MSDGQEDDWFERALRKREGGEDAETPGDADEDSAFDPDDSAAESADDPASPGTGGDPDAGGPDASVDAFNDDSASSDGSMFDDDFATAFENAGAPDDPGDGPSDFGMGGDPGGFGGPGAFGGDGFDDEEFESGIPRIDIGIEGLDSMILGGVPERSLMVAIGNAGTGKTTFGLQFLHEALENGESAVYITLEESYDRIVDTAVEKGWDFERHVEEGRLAVIDLDPIEMANTLTSIRSELPELVTEFGATRLVLDSVSLLEMMYEDQATRRNEVFDFTESLKEAGVTTMLTSEASEDNPYASRFGIIEYLTDAVFVLRYVRSTDSFRETRLAIEIQKIRDANHSREIKPYEITNDGISVYEQANLF